MSKRIKPLGVAPKDLKIGSVYFALSYVDKAMLVPVLVTYVYIGLEHEEGEKRYLFQDAYSYFNKDADGIEVEAFVDDTGVSTLDAVILELQEVLAEHTRIMGLT